MKIRTTKTSSGSIAVQVIAYSKRKVKILAHIGSARKEADIMALKKIASAWIHSNSNPQLSFIPQFERSFPAISPIVQIDKCEYLGFRYQLLYDVLWNLTVKFKFHLLIRHKQQVSNAAEIINDLVIARISAPGSKVEAFEFIKDYFGINHSRRDFYRILRELPGLKSDAEAKSIAVAKKYFGFNFSFVFYDLTTLYFESEKDEEGFGLRKIGFSKENKSSNPQIMIGLLVNDQGFPISYQIFPGNKFEGHTLMPSILAIKNKHKIQQMTIVADSAMISDENVRFLKSQSLNYIVAARTANLPITTIEEISKQLNRQDEAIIRIPTESKGDLILSFSKKRYDKEKREMDKHVEKANLYLKRPSSAEIIKRTKFLKGKNQGYELNQNLIDKTNLLLGIKGYYTNCDEEKFSNQEIIKHYKNLWNVEKSFRISKSDLKVRPIFHSKQQAIEAHILICFMALAIAKYIEIKTSKSIKAVVKELKKITDARIYDTITKKTFTLRSNINPVTQKMLDPLQI